MITTMCSLKIARNGLEQQQSSSLFFPCCAYHGDLHDYLTSQVPPHWHHEFEIMMVDSGTALVSLAGEELQLQSGNGYFISADKLHSISCMVKTPCMYRSLVFDPVIIGTPGSVFDTRYIRPFLEHGPSSLRLQTEEGWQQPIFSAFDKIFSIFKEEPLGYEFTVRDSLSQIILLLAQHYRVDSPPPNPNSKKEQKLKKIISWIDSHYTQQITVRLLADAVHISSRECERVFKQLLHSSPMSYLRLRRITAASELLASSDLPIAEIGLRCGFLSHSYFSQQFHLLTGNTPQGYRLYIRTMSC